MTQEKRDKLLRDKMNALDTLSGGIVFGKEEAWDKLQQRMEQKPAKKIALKYWLATAAVLLLMVSVVGIYRHPVNEIASNTKEKTQPAAIDIKPVNTPAVIPQPESMQVTNTPIAKSAHRHVTKTPKDIQAPKSIATITQPVPQVEHIDDNKVVVSEPPAPVIPSPQPMKVIHINDLYKKEVAQQSATIVAVATVDLSKLPKVHINDVIQDEYQVRRILKENRSSFIRLPFIHHENNYDASSDAEDQIPYTLKIRFNPQN